MIFLDTHVLVWLYEKKLELVPETVQSILEEEDLFISPIVILELEYLFEIKKIKIKGQKIVSYLEKNLGLIVSEDQFSTVVNAALTEKWTRDPFDRIIASHAKFNKASLLTRDKIIQKHYNKAMWG